MTPTEKKKARSAPLTICGDEGSSDGVHRRDGVTELHGSGEGGGTDVAIFPVSPWLTYTQAAAYTGLSVRYLRNLVSADAIPVYGSPRSRRFRRDVLDQFLTNRDVAMRKFRLEGSAQRDD